MLAFKIVFGRFSLKWIIGFLFILFRIYFYSSKHACSNTFEIMLRVEWEMDCEITWQHIVVE